MRNRAGAKGLAKAAGLLLVLIAFSMPAGRTAAQSQPAGDQKDVGGGEATIKWEEGANQADHGPGTARGQLRDGTVMAALLNLDGRLLLAATDGKTIQVLKVEDGLHPVADFDPKDYRQILALKWWRPSADQPLYLCMVAWSGHRVSASVLALKDERLMPAVDGLDTILGTFDLDGDRLPETLLGQEFDPENFFGRRIKERYWQRGKLATRDPAIDLPPQFTVIGGQLADLTGDGKPEATHVRNGILRIFAGSREIYASAKEMGGSLSVLTYKKNPEAKDFITTSAYFEVSPVAMDVDADGGLELVAISANPSSVKVPGFLPAIEESRLIIFKYRNDGGFIKGTLGEPVPAAIQGLAAVDKRVWYVACEPGRIVGRHGTSRLLFFSLPRR